MQIEADIFITEETELATVEYSLHCKFHYHPATRDYYDKSFGQWLPGEGAVLEDVESVCTEIRVDFGGLKESIVPVSGRAIGDCIYDKYTEKVEDQLYEKAVEISYTE